MKFFLIAVILALCGGGYYEYLLQQQKSFDQEHKINDLTSQADKLVLGNKSLEEEKTELAKNLADAQAKIVDLTSQVATLSKAADDAKKTAVPANTSIPSADSTVVVGSFNNLGKVETLDGKTFQNCQLLRVEADGITFNHSAGITKILFPLLKPDIQKKFGFDISQGTTLTPEQVQAEEQQRVAALPKPVMATKPAVDTKPAATTSAK